MPDPKEDCNFSVSHVGDLFIWPCRFHGRHLAFFFFNYRGHMSAFWCVIIHDNVSNDNSYKSVDYKWKKNVFIKFWLQDCFMYAVVASIHFQQDLELRVTLILSISFIWANNAFNFSFFFLVTDYIYISQRRCRHFCAAEIFFSVPDTFMKIVFLASMFNTKYVHQPTLLKLKALEKSLALTHLWP